MFAQSILNLLLQTNLQEHTKMKNLPYTTTILSYIGIWAASTIGALVTDSALIGAVIAIVFITREAIKEYNAIPDTKLPNIDFIKLEVELKEVRTKLEHSQELLNSLQSDVSNIQMANGIKKLK